MATAVTANRAELIAIANSVAAEKLIDKGIVIEAMEDAIQRAAKGWRTTSARSSTRPPATCGCGECSRWSRRSRTISSRPT